MGNIRAIPCDIRLYDVYSPSWQASLCWLSLWFELATFVMQVTKGHGDDALSLGGKAAGEMNKGSQKLCKEYRPRPRV
jgi:hypothetical protein